ncbi:MAG: hypothetical protein U0166_02505 [Acidobacteriota bacterium]
MTNAISLPPAPRSRAQASRQRSSARIQARQLTHPFCSTSAMWARMASAARRPIGATEAWFM